MSKTQEMIFIHICLFCLSDRALGNLKQNLSPRLVRTIIANNMPHMKNCYQNSLKTSKVSFDFKSILKFTIAENGNTKKVHLEVKPNKNRNLIKIVSKCIQVLVMKLKFPKNRQSTNISQPLHFSTDRD